MKHFLRSPVLALALLLAFGAPCRATLLSFDILPGHGDANFLFDPSLGVLNSLWIEYEYSTVAVYTNFFHTRPLGRAIVYATWYDTTTLVVGNGTSREFNFDWQASGRGDNGPHFLESFFVYGDTRRQSMTFSGMDIPEFFLAQGDEDRSLVTLTESPNGTPFITPEATGDTNGNQWIIEMTGVNLETLRVTYLYDTPEPSTFVLLGLGALGLARCRRQRR